MRSFPLLALLLISLFDPLAAQAQVAEGSAGYPPPMLEGPPRSGIGGIAVGAGALGIAALNLVTMPICFAEVYPSAAKDGCVIASLVLAGLGVSVALPSLLLGLHRHARYKEWKARQRAFAPREQLSLRPSQAGLSLHYVSNF